LPLRSREVTTASAAKAADASNAYLKAVMTSPLGAETPRLWVRKPNDGHRNCEA
jgi:hypothetical protein